MRVNAHGFVAALALLVERLLGRRLNEAPRGAWERVDIRGFSSFFWFVGLDRI
jgi:hypothetical protein